MRDTILVGDVLERLRELPDDYVQCVCTSPPYWNLRDYGVPDQHGLEPTIDKYVAKQVAVFHEVSRVLRPDGACLVNLGDSYTSGGRKSYGTFTPESTQATHPEIKRTPRAAQPDGLKPKDLCGIPWRVALALQADGWWLRSDIVWAKPNPMPESVTDRPTRSHEYIFLLTKSARYFWDQEAVREPSNGWRGSSFTSAQDVETKPGLGTSERVESSGRNLRSVWTIPTFAFPEAHFATFPPEIPRRCILAGTPIKCCGVCGAPWERVTEKRDTGRTQKMPDGFNTHDGGHGSIHPDSRESGMSGTPVTENITLSFRPTCAHDDDTGRSIVLDPYMGSGTTGLVAKELGRDYIGIELNPEYADMAERRIRGEVETRFKDRTARERAGQGVLI